MLGPVLLVIALILLASPTDPVETGDARCASADRAATAQVRDARREALDGHQLAHALSLVAAARMRCAFGVVARGLAAYDDARRVLAEPAHHEAAGWFRR